MRRLAWIPLLLLAAPPAYAQAQLSLPELTTITTESARAGRPAWSVVSAQTVGTNADVFNFQVGYPGISAAYLHGQNDHFDVGEKLTFLYGSESSTFVQPGFRAQGLLRFLLGSNGRVRFGLEFEPGIYTYFAPFFPAPFAGGGTFGLVLPIKLTFGIPVSPVVSVHAGIDLPLMFNFVPGFEAAIPILFGGGAEYLVTPDLSLTFRMRLGPSIYAGAVGSGVTLGLDILLGVAVRL